MRDPYTIVLHSDSFFFSFVYANVRSIVDFAALFRREPKTIVLQCQKHATRDFY